MNVGMYISLPLNSCVLYCKVQRHSISTNYLYVFPPPPYILCCCCCYHNHKHTFVYCILFQKHVKCSVTSNNATGSSSLLSINKYINRYVCSYLCDICATGKKVKTELDQLSVMKSTMWHSGVVIEGGACLPFSLYSLICLSTLFYLRCYSHHISFDILHKYICNDVYMYLWYY